jgi:hypothetical protein
MFLFKANLAENIQLWKRVMNNRMVLVSFYLN